MFRKLMMLMTGEGTTGAGGAGAGAAGAAAAAAAAGAGGAGAGTGGAAGAGGAGAAAGAAAAGTAGAAGAAAGATGAQGGAAAAGSSSSFVAGATQQQTGGQGATGAGASAPASLDALTLPEGVTRIDQPLFDGFKAFAKEKQIPPGQAQELLNFYAKQVAEQDKAATVAAEQRAVEQRKALEADPKIGGANLPKSMELARQAIVRLDRQADGLGTQLAKELDAAGMGDSVVAARLLAFLGERLSEDSTGATGGAAPAAGTAEAKVQNRYGNTLRHMKEQGQR